MKNNQQKYKYIMIIGKSATGKDTLVKYLLNNYNYYNKVISCTTRPKRDNEIEGIDYYFKTNKDFYQCKDIVESTSYQVFETEWIYYYTKSEFNNKVRNNKVGILICNPHGVKHFKDHQPKIFNDSLLIYLYCNSSLRKDRYYQRELKFNKSSIDSLDFKWQKRKIQDIQDFNDFLNIYEDDSILSFNTSIQSIDSIVKEITRLIKE